MNTFNLGECADDEIETQYNTMKVISSTYIVSKERQSTIVEEDVDQLQFIYEKDLNLAIHLRSSKTLKPHWKKKLHHTIQRPHPNNLAFLIPQFPFRFRNTTNFFH